MNRDNLLTSAGDGLHRLLSQILESSFRQCICSQTVHYFISILFRIRQLDLKGHIWHIEIAVKLISKLAQLSYNEFEVLRLKAMEIYQRIWRIAVRAAFADRFGQEARETLHIRFWIWFCDFTRLARNYLNSDEILNRQGDTIFNELNGIWVKGTQF